jgi:hypothetical protein
MFTQEKPNNITSIRKMAPRRLSIHHGSSKCFILFNTKRLLQILAATFSQEQGQMGEREKSGRDLGIVTGH